MITIDNVQYRNLEEQVKKNMDDIQYILEEEGVLNEFGIKIVGQITSSSDLPDPDTYEGEYGDAYAVGTDAPYTIYIYTRANGTHPNDYWFNIGQFPLAGKDGAQGPTGPAGPQGVRGSTWTNGTSAPTTSGNLPGDKYLNTTNGDVYNYTGSTWQLVGNIRGPQGIQGVQGNVGPQGQQGIQGPKGEKGDPGPAFVIAGTVSSTGQLPDPSTLSDNIAYLVGSDNDYDLYVQLQGTRTWQNVGKVEGVQGPPGPQGEQGPQGIQGIQGIQGPAGTNGKDGRGITSVTNGSPVTTEQYTQTPVTVTYSDSTNSQFIVYAEKGRDGTNGADGAPGPQGPKGDTGEQGPQGIQGPTGPAGEVDYSQVYKKVEDISIEPGSPSTQRGGLISIDNYDAQIERVQVGDTVSGFGIRLEEKNGNRNVLQLSPNGIYTSSSGVSGHVFTLGHKSGVLAIQDDITSAISNLNISQYATTAYVDSKVSGVFTYKGSVASYSDLPSSGNVTGDVWNVEDTGDNYAWNGTTWDKLAGEIDLSAYATTANVTSAIANSEANTNSAIAAVNSRLGDYLPLSGGTIGTPNGNRIVANPDSSTSRLYILANESANASLQIGTTNQQTIYGYDSINARDSAVLTFPTTSGTLATTNDISNAVANIDLSSYETTANVNSKLSGYIPLSSDANISITMSNNSRFELNDNSSTRGYMALQPNTRRIYYKSDFGDDTYLQLPLNPKSAIQEIAITSQIPKAVSQLQNDLQFVSANTTNLENYLPITGGTMSGQLNTTANILSNAYIMSGDRLNVNPPHPYSYLYKGEIGIRNSPSSNIVITTSNIKINGTTILHYPNHSGTLATLEDISGGGGGDYLPLTGGNMTGNINVGNSASINVDWGIGKNVQITSTTVKVNSGSIRDTVSITGKGLQRGSKVFNWPSTSHQDDTFALLSDIPTFTDNGDGTMTITSNGSTFKVAIVTE